MELAAITGSMYFSVRCRLWSALTSRYWVLVTQMRKLDTEMSGWWSTQTRCVPGA